MKLASNTELFFLSFCCIISSLNELSAIFFNELRKTCWAQQKYFM